MAQTTPKTLFGPVLLTAAQSNPTRCHRSLARTNKTGKKKKSLTYGPNNVSCIVWACFTCCCPTQPNCPHETLVEQIKHERKKNHLLMAQMTRLTSFGPILLAATQLNSTHHRRILVEPK